jgi:hypothetical protein
VKFMKFVLRIGANVAKEVVRVPARRVRADQAREVKIGRTSRKNLDQSSEIGGRSTGASLRLAATSAAFWLAV